MLQTTQLVHQLTIFDPYVLVPMTKASISIGVITISPPKSFGLQEYRIAVNTEIIFMVKLDFRLRKDFGKRNNNFD